MKPLAVDLCSGLGGWSDGLIAEGWDVVGFDIERHVYGDQKYPGQLVLQDIRTIDGRQFKGKVSLIVASPPCQKYSYMAMPWTRAKQLAVWYRDQAHPERLVELNELFDACFRIAREAECPIVVENVRGAVPWVGRARATFGSFYLWGDVPALMPITKRRGKGPKAGTGNQLCCVRVDQIQDDGEGQKNPGFRFDGSGGSFQTASVKATKNDGGSWLNVAHNTTSGHKQNPVHAAIDNANEGRKGYMSGTGNLGKSIVSRQTSSRSSARKAASAHIAKIPLPLARHIARVYYP